MSDKVYAIATTCLVAGLAVGIAIGLFVSGLLKPGDCVIGDAPATVTTTTAAPPVAGLDGLVEPQ
jgi:hypothetical protein